MGGDCEPEENKIKMFQKRPISQERKQKKNLKLIRVLPDGQNGK